MGACCQPDSSTAKLKNVTFQKLRELSDKDLQIILLKFVEVRCAQMVSSEHKQFLNQIWKQRHTLPKINNVKNIQNYQEYFEKMFKNFSIQFQMMSNYERKIRKDLQSTQEKHKEWIKQFEIFVDKIKKGDKIKKQMGMESRNSDKFSERMSERLSAQKSTLEVILIKMIKISENSQGMEDRQLNQILKLRKQEALKTFEKTIESFQEQISVINEEISHSKDKIQNLQIKLQEKDALYLQKCEILKEKQDNWKNERQKYEKRLQQLSRLKVTKQISYEDSQPIGHEKLRRQTDLQGLKNGKRSKITKSYLSNQRSDAIVQKRRGSSIFKHILPISQVLFHLEKEKGVQNRQTINNLFKIYGKRIHSSFKVFSYDKMNPTSLAEYLQNHQNLLFIAKVSNDIIIGGYSRQNYLSKDEDNDSFIFSIHPNGEYYQLTLKNENRKRKLAVKLDKNFLIFGSNEIRIKCQALTGYANIYGSAAIYECRSKQVSFEHFTGSNDRSFEMTMMEVHALNLQHASQYGKKPEQ